MDRVLKDELLAIGAGVVESDGGKEKYAGLLAKLLSDRQRFL